MSGTRRWGIGTGASPRGSRCGIGTGGGPVGCACGIGTGRPDTWVQSSGAGRADAADGSVTSTAASTPPVSRSERLMGR